MNAYWKIGLLLALVIASFTAGCYVTSWKLHAQQEAQEAVALDDRVKQEKAGNEVAMKTENTVASDEAKGSQIIYREKADVAKNPAGYACVVPAAGLQSLRDLAAARAGGR